MTAGTKRTPDDNIVVGDPYTFLAVAIIDQAYKDLLDLTRTFAVRVSALHKGENDDNQNINQGHEPRAVA